MNSNEKSKPSVKDLRLNAGLTQRAVSVVLDVRCSTVSDWERGIVEPRLPLSKVRTLVSLYKCTLDELVDAFENVQQEKHQSVFAQETKLRLPVAS